MPEPGPESDRSPEPAAPDASPAAPSPAAAPAAARSPATAPRPQLDESLLGLVDRLSAVLERSDLMELEIEAGGTALLLRKPLAPPAAPPEVRHAAPPPATVTPSPAPEETAPPRLSVKAPLTGLFYTAPTPGSAPYVRVGGEVAVGQVIGLIEAMKLFNEIKSDLAGRVVRFAAESGALVKAKQPLIEVEPL
jgi:acetyl-CoA carboxylase biotin carboxyl carrier protein